MSPDEILYHIRYCNKQAAPLGDANVLYKNALLQRALSSAQQDSLVKLRGLVLAQVMFEDLVDQLEEILKAVASEYRDLTETILPSLMDELGVPKLAISESQSVELKVKITANIPKEKIEEGCKWLIDNGFGAIIKQVVSTEFGTKQSEEAAKVVEAIKALKLEGIEPSVKKSVNHMTLGALVREQLEEGTELPFETLGIYRRRASVVSTKKN